MFDITTRTGQIDDLLAIICEELQLSPTQHATAEQRYNTIGRWLAESDRFRPARPQIYSQGSLGLGTTVKPQNRQEYDLDLVCEFALRPEQVQNPIHLLDAVEARLRENDIYNGMVSRKNRCIRITYANDFYLDILPAIPDPTQRGTCLLVPDREAKTWKASNPRGYISWFADRAAVRQLVEATKRVEPLPDHETAAEKEPLKLAVQLLKRQRDIAFQSAVDGIPPISIVLTTLAAETYTGQRSINDALNSILAGIVGRLPGNGRLYVYNPQNSHEDLSEKWDQKPGAYEAFASWIRSFQKQWMEANSKTGIQALTLMLEQSFGESVARNAVAKQAVRIQEARKHGALGIGTIGTLAPSASAATVSNRRIPRNEFYGD
jgi:hypothetical protein